jgi:hypothetical protein
VCSSDLSIGGVSDPDRIAETTVTESSGIISDCDTVFNEDENFSVGGDGGTYDIQTVALHEFGHWLCLLDLSWFWNSSKVMYGAYTGVKTSLHQDDINGIIYIYGED